MPDSTAESFSAVPQDSPPSERGNCDTTVVGTGATFRPAGFPFAPPAAPGEVGVLGAYRLLKQLGKGGMGAVYLALDARLGRKLAEGDAPGGRRRRREGAVPPRSPGRGPDQPR